jgi:hypothetical protein
MFEISKMSGHILLTVVLGRKKYVFKILSQKFRA